MSYYLVAYLIFWAALFGYLIGLTRRQARLVERSARLVDRLTARPAAASGGHGAGDARNAP